MMPEGSIERQWRLKWRVDVADLDDDEASGAAAADTEVKLKGKLGADANIWQWSASQNVYTNSWPGVRGGCLSDCCSLRCTSISAGSVQVGRQLRPPAQQCHSHSRTTSGHAATLSGARLTAMNLPSNAVLKIWTPALRPPRLPPLQRYPRRFAHSARQLQRRHPLAPVDATLPASACWRHRL